LIRLFELLIVTSFLFLFDVTGKTMMLLQHVVCALQLEHVCALLYHVLAHVRWKIWPQFSFTASFFQSESRQTLQISLWWTSFFSGVDLKKISGLMHPVKVSSPISTCAPKVGTSRLVASSKGTVSNGCDTISKKSNLLQTGAFPEGKVSNGCDTI